jgi:electron transfer flavoprotein-quinone oxidoreductase
VNINTEFDVIVIGAGIAGSTCAIKAAQLGLSVLMIERGEPIGSKNMSGGVLWGNDLQHILGENWYEEAPVERYVLRKGIGFLAKEDATFVDMRIPEWSKPPYNGWMVLRAKFDPWLASKASEAGVEVYSGITIYDLLIEKKNNKDQISGIIESGDEFRSKAVILAEGASSRLAIDHGLKPETRKNVSPLRKKDYMLGIKEVIHMPKDILENRFALRNNMEGAAYEMVSGIHDDGARVGGFLYTNKETLSLGIVIQLETIKQGMHTYTLFEEFKSHPWIQSIIEGGQRIEYGAHLIPHGGYKSLPKLVHNGALLVGDAAGFLLSNGMSINGMNYAASSGMIAAEAISEAIKKSKTLDEKALSSYTKKLKKSYFYNDLKRFKNVDKLLANPRVFKQYPAVINDMLKELLYEKGWQSTPKHLHKKPKVISAGLKVLKKNKVSKFRVILDGLKIRHL